MPPASRLSPKDRRVVLKQLPRERLAELTSHFELEVADRRSVDAHVDAIVRKRSLDFRDVLEHLRRDELQAICSALGLGSGGREKAMLVDRILGVKPQEEAIAVATTSDMPPPSGHGQSGVKSLLRRFVVRTAAEYLGRDATARFTSRLLQSFGWPEAGPTDATMPASVAVVEGSQRATRSVSLLWSARRVLIDVVKHDVMLDYAWKELLRVCLQLDPVPQYVVLTNQRELHLYDLARDREAPRLAIALDDLPKYSEAFPFLSPHWVPGTTPTIINVSKVSTDVAGLVAKLYRSLKEQHPTRERDVVQFTLQCILTMFAEDIGLLPQEYFTTLLYEGARHRDVERRLAELFRLMSTRDVPGQRAVPYFNGGLFAKPVALPLGEAQLGALTKASEANWKYVDPHIFGSVFQGIMNDAERHKRGAHYTAHEDIMRVVGPTIVEPWRKRIRAARTLAELLEVRRALLAYRVLDPACGSGNFLYVAFRELYRLDTELIARLREFPSTQGDKNSRISWGAGIQTANFFGIDINPFAVELAKVTLNIAKKIAFDERRDTAADLFGQLEMETDPSLPLDNLDSNIVRGDALFTDWPQVDAIVGNPPFLGGLKIRGELGAAYLQKLQGRYPGVNGRADLCAYWFRRAHDHLREGGRAGLVATNTIRDGHTREAAADYVANGGGTITNAVSSRPWPGEAIVNVSMVNWIKGTAPPAPRHLVVEGQVYEVDAIPTNLQLHADVAAASKLRANARGTSQGMVLGTKEFQMDAATARSLATDRRARAYVRPVAVASHLLRGRLAVDPEYVVDLTRCASETQAAEAGAAFEYLKTHAYPVVRHKAETATTDHYKNWLRTWWRPFWPRLDFLEEIGTLGRIIACSRHAARPIFVFLSRKFFSTESLQLFAFDDDYSFGVLQSNLHWQWAVAVGSKIKEDTRYTGDVWAQFPWPQEPSEGEVAAVAEASRELRRVRETLSGQNGWSLRDLYQAAEVPGPHPLKDAQAALDAAVQRAYGMPAGREGNEFLLELNKLVAEDEAEGRAVQGPGLPRGLDPRDPRWTSDDCIQPPTP